MLEHPKYAALGNEGAPGFNWEVYEDGWTGTGLKVNKKVKVRPNSKDKVYSHEPYAQELYNRTKKMRVENVKDIKKGTSVSISNLDVIDDKTLVATIGNGASNITIDLTKENEKNMISQTEHELTGFPSIDKPWLKYYSEEAIRTPLPQKTLYRYLYEKRGLY